MPLSWRPAPAAAAATFCPTQASLGLVLPTLIIWRALLAVARKRLVKERHAHSLPHSREQQAGSPPHMPHPPLKPGRGVEASAPGHQQLDAMQYKLCAWLLDTAGAYTWPVPVGLPGLVAFAAAVVWQSNGGM